MAFLYPRHNQAMRFASVVLVNVVSGVALGLWRGTSGWEMLSPQERLWIAVSLAIVWLVSILLLRTNRSWIPAVASITLCLLFVVASGKLFEPRLHMNFNGNGLLCWSRSLPAALLTALFAVVVLKPRRVVSIGLLAASAAMLSQTIYCPIVESRHIAQFHAGQLVIWPVVVALIVFSLRPSAALR